MNDFMEQPIPPDPRDITHIKYENLRPSEVLVMKSHFADCPGINVEKDLCIWDYENPFTPRDLPIEPQLIFNADRVMGAVFSGSLEEQHGNVGTLLTDLASEIRQTTPNGLKVSSQGGGLRFDLIHLSKKAELFQAITTMITNHSKSEHFPLSEQDSEKIQTVRDAVLKIREQLESVPPQALRPPGM